MTLPADEFIRRFLQHAVPPGFQRIRYYGFLANCHRSAKLALCRQLLATAASLLLPQSADCHDFLTALTRTDLRLCPSAATESSAVCRSPAPLRSAWTVHDARRSNPFPPQHCPPGSAPSTCAYTPCATRIPFLRLRLHFIPPCCALSPSFYRLLPSLHFIRPSPPRLRPQSPPPNRTKPIKGRSCRSGLVHCAVSSISRLQPPSSSNFSRRETEETFFIARNIKIIFPLFSIISYFRPEYRLPPCYFQIGRRSCAPLARPQQFLSWPGYVACLVVLTSRTPRKGITVVPLRGGDRREDLPFERNNTRGMFG